MFIAWVIFHVIVCVGLILVVLLQSSKGEGLAGTALGGGGGLSGAVFGGRGAGSFLSKATTVLAILFMINSIALAFMSSSKIITTTSSGEESVVTKMAQEERDRLLQQQQQQQQAADTAGGLEITPIEGTTTPSDSQ